MLPRQIVDRDSMVITPFGMGSGHAGFLRASGSTGTDGSCSLSVRKPRGVETFTVRVRVPAKPVAIVPAVSLPASGNRVVVVVPDAGTLSLRLVRPPCSSCNRTCNCATSTTV